MTVAFDGVRFSEGYDCTAAVWVVFPDQIEDRLVLEVCGDVRGASEGRFKILAVTASVITATSLPSLQPTTAAACSHVNPNSFTQNVAAATYQ